MSLSSEAKGKLFYANENEWRAAVYLDDKQSREHLLAIARSIDSRYKTLTQTLAHLTSLLTNSASPTSPASPNATHPASSNAPTQPKVDHHPLQRPPHHS